MRHVSIALLGCLLSSLAGCGAEVDLGERGGPVTDVPTPDKAQLLGVGDPCLPSEEKNPAFSGFSGFSPSEINLESNLFLGKSLVCLVNHFRGRVTCPLGQDAALAAKAQAYMEMRKKDPWLTLADAGFSEQEQAQVCRAPYGPSVVTSVVQPQCTSRQAKDSVYYSCRCGGNDPDAAYCVCPENFECNPLFELENQYLPSIMSGSFCIRSSDLTINSKGQRVIAYQPGDCPHDSAGHPANSCDAASLNCGVASNAPPLY